MEFRPRPVVKGYSRCRRTRAPLKIKSQKAGPLFRLKNHKLVKNGWLLHWMKILLKGSAFCCKGPVQKLSLVEVSGYESSMECP